MIKIAGADKLLRQLDQLEKRGAKSALRKSMTAGLKVLRDAVRDETPVDKGLLKKDEDSKVIGSGLNLGGIVGANVAKLNEQAASSDGKRPTNLDYLVEFGHTDSDGRFIPGKGFMRRAADGAMPEAEAAFVARLASEIEKEASR